MSAINELAANPPSDDFFKEKDIESLKQTIRDAQDPSTSGLNYLGKSVFDVDAMAPLNKTSLAVIARLRAYKPPPFALWDRLPVSRRAAVLVLLYADRRGDLRVVITMRATSLRNYSGHAAFPGGKADSLEESPFEIARREAWEEIGLPNDDSKLPAPFKIEHMCELPYNLARTALAVRPCVAFLHSEGESGQDKASVEETMMPRLDAKEVAAVFSAPFHNFLRATDEPRPGEIIPGKPTDWYDGHWIDWNESKWRSHSFHVPIINQTVSKPKNATEGVQEDTVEKLKKEEETGLTRYKVWGMTARMLVDAARIAYDEDPEFEHNDYFGDERMIENIHSLGQMEDKKKTTVLTEAELEKAAKM